MPVRVALVFGLVMLKVSDVVPLRGIVAAPKALVMVGGLATERFADAVLPEPPFVEDIGPVVLV
jgi:hypothetical protein